MLILDLGSHLLHRHRTEVRIQAAFARMMVAAPASSWHTAFHTIREADVILV